MTPMKRLSGGLTTLKEYVHPFFENVVLNKSSPKYDPSYSGSTRGNYGYSKGVESDFVSIFKNKNTNLSFGITFNYQGLAESDQVVFVTIKTTESNEQMRSSVPMSVEEFRLKLNAFNKELKVMDMKPVSIIEKVSSIFLNIELNIKEEMNEANKKIAQFINEQSVLLNINVLEDVQKKAHNKLTLAQTIVQNALEDSEEYKRIEQITKELAQLKGVVEKNKKSLMKANDVDNLNKEFIVASKETEKAKEKLNKEIEKEIKKLPPMIAKGVKNKI